MQNWSLQILQAVSIESCFQTTTSIYEESEDIACEKVWENEIFGEDDTEWIQSKSSFVDDPSEEYDYYDFPTAADDDIEESNIFDSDRDYDDDL